MASTIPAQTLTISPINGNDIIDPLQALEGVPYSGKEQGLDGETLNFIYQIDYGNQIPWPGAK